MSNVDRIQKFVDDQTALLTAKAATGKINSEISKLKTWLVKHQDEAVPDGSKGKIAAILEKYNRASGYLADIRPAVLGLFNDYLQLPEGKLVNSKEKNRILTWVRNMDIGNEDVAEDPTRAAPAPITSVYLVDTLDKKKRTVSMFNTKDPDDWKEDTKLTMEDFAKVEAFISAGKSSVSIEIDNASDNVVSVGIHQEEEGGYNNDDSEGIVSDCGERG